MERTSQEHFALSKSFEESALDAQEEIRKLIEHLEKTNNVAYPPMLAAQRAYSMGIEMATLHALQAIYQKLNGR